MCKKVCGPKKRIDETTWKNQSMYQDIILRFVLEQWKRIVVLLQKATRGGW